MKLVISKSKDGKGYYSKIKNDYNDKHIEKYLSLQMPKDNEFEYGLYSVDGFISVYEKKDGTPEFKFVVTDAMLEKKYENDNLKGFEDITEFENLNTKTASDVGKQIKIDSSELPF